MLAGNMAAKQVLRKLMAQQSMAVFLFQLNLKYQKTLNWV